MKLPFVLWLCFFPSFLAAAKWNVDYKGFNRCGTDGWSCVNQPNGNYETIFDCSVTTNPDGRMWVWTARIPSQTTVLTFRNCRTVELHFDCTAGYRAYNIMELNIINVNKLVFLETSVPGTYLHDNVNTYQAPPSVLIRNVSSMALPSGVFKPPSAAGKCRNASGKLTQLTLEHVNLSLAKRILESQQVLSQLIWRNVTVVGAWTNGVSIIANYTEITDSVIGQLQPYSLIVRGATVTMERNSITELATNSINVKCKNFNFNGNIVTRTLPSAFQVTGRNIQVTNNKWHEFASVYSSVLPKGPFQSIAPGQPNNGEVEIFTNFVYNFSFNEVFKAGNQSLEMNPIYYEACSHLVVRKNIFHCACNDTEWLNATTKFLDLLFNKTNQNHCSGNGTCLLSTVMNPLTLSCKTNDSICFGNDTEPEFPQSYTGDALTDSTEEYDVIFASYSPETDPLLPFKISYYDNQSLVDESTIPNWFIVVASVTTVIIITAIAAFYAYAARRRRHFEMTSMYKNVKGGEMNAVMLENEY